MEVAMTEARDTSNGVTPAMWPAQHLAGRLIGGIYGIAVGASTAVKTLRRQEALRHELQRLSDFDLADIGITRAQIGVVAGSHKAPELMRQMLARLGIPETVLQDAALRYRLQRACATCFSRAHCRRWLRRGGPSAGYKAFCPNGEEFEPLIAQS
jgi:uncharacterized protein YjiS (DUF1127 family)